MVGATACGGARGRLILLPSTLGDEAPLATVSSQALEILNDLSHLIVESPKQARRFLLKCGLRLSERAIHFSVLDEHTTDDALPALLQPVLEGHDAGVLSDAGCPAVADPGGRLVRLAHERDIEVVPLVGPSSIMLALMASGLNGQRFAFHGYLPVEASARTRSLLALDKSASARGETQAFIETPYRNNQLLAAILHTCSPETLLCVAVDLTLPTQWIRTAAIRRWRDAVPDIKRRPAVFLIGGSSG